MHAAQSCVQLCINRKLQPSLAPGILLLGIVCVTLGCMSFALAMTSCKVASSDMCWEVGAGRGCCKMLCTALCAWLPLWHRAQAGAYL